MSAAVDPREARLPKWVQNELRTLRMRLRYAEQHIKDVAGDIAETNTYVDGMRGDDRNHALPSGARVAYQLRDRPIGGAVRVWLQTDRWAGTRLHVQGDRSLVIEPSASNSFYVTMPD